MTLFSDRQVGRLCAWSMKLNEGDRPAHGVAFERRPRRRKGGVHNVHTLAVGLGRTGAGLGRTRHVFWSSQCFRGVEAGSSPTSGTVLPVQRLVCL